MLKGRTKGFIVHSYNAGYYAFATLMGGHEKFYDVLRGGEKVSHWLFSHFVAAPPPPPPPHPSINSWSLKKCQALLSDIPRALLWDTL